MAFCGSASFLAPSIEWIKDGEGHPLSSRHGRQQSLSKGSELNSILRDARGYLWLGAWVPVSTGSMNAAVGSSITRTTLVIPTA